jgi:hypothetical protein
VKDTKFERTQHEATGKHQGNLKRFLRGIQDGHDKDERERQRARSEIERLNRAVGGESSATSTSAQGKALPPASRTAVSANVSQATIADRKRQMAQLAEMGVFVPDEYRREMALAGDWEVISEKPLGHNESPASTIGVRKRLLEDREEGEEAEAESDTNAQADQRDPSGKPAVKRNKWGTAIKQYPSLPKQDLDSLLAGSLSAKTPKKEEKEKEEEEEEADLSPPTLKKEYLDQPMPATETVRSHHNHTPQDLHQISDPPNPAAIPTVKTEAKQENISPSNLPNYDRPTIPDQDSQHAIQNPGSRDGSGTEPGAVVFKKRKAKNSRPR